MNRSAGNLKKGDFVVYQAELWQVQKTEFSFQGRGMAVIRTKLKNIVSQKNIDLTFKSNEDIELAEISTVEMQYLYNDGTNLHFMNERTYNQYFLPQQTVGDFANFLKPGDKYYLFLYGEKLINIRPPSVVRLKVTTAENAVKGDTVSGAKKQVKVETGVLVTTPLFIKQGDVIIVNPETGEYIERVKS